MVPKILCGAVLIGFLMIFASCEKNDITNAINNDLQDVTENPFAIDKSPSVPFHASYTTHPAVYNPGEEFICSGEPGYFIPGEGHGTHLGNSTWYSETRIVLDENGLFQQTGCQIFTAADGSTLTGEYCGEVIFIGPDPLGATGSGGYNITSGSGRFEGVTGCGTYSYFVDSELDEDGNWLAHLEFDGHLDKNKKGNPMPCDVECGYSND